LQDVTHGSFLATSIFLACCLLAAGLVMLALRRSGDRPLSGARLQGALSGGAEAEATRKKTS
jgi:hypothetical protein